MWVLVAIIFIVTISAAGERDFGVLEENWCRESLVLPGTVNLSRLSYRFIIPIKGLEMRFVSIHPAEGKRKSRKKNERVGYMNAILRDF